MKAELIRGEGEMPLAIVAEDGAFFLLDDELSHELVSAFCREAHGWTLEQISTLVVEYYYHSSYLPPLLANHPGLEAESDGEARITGAYMRLHTGDAERHAYLSTATVKRLTSEHPWICQLVNAEIQRRR